MKKRNKKFSEDVKKYYLDSIDFINKDTKLNNFILTDITVFDNEQELIKYAIDNVPFNACTAYVSFHRYNQNEKVDITDRLF